MNDDELTELATKDCRRVPVDLCVVARGCRVPPEVASAVGRTHLLLQCVTWPPGTCQPPKEPSGINGQLQLGVEDGLDHRHVYVLAEANDTNLRQLGWLK